MRYGQVFGTCLFLVLLQEGVGTVPRPGWSSDKGDKGRGTCLKHVQCTPPCPLLRELLPPNTAIPPPPQPRIPGWHTCSPWTVRRSGAWPSSSRARGQPSPSYSPAPAPAPPPPRAPRRRRAPPSTARPPPRPPAASPPVLWPCSRPCPSWSPAPTAAPPALSCPGPAAPWRPAWRPTTTSRCFCGRGPPPAGPRSGPPPPAPRSLRCRGCSGPAAGRW